MATGVAEGLAAVDWRAVEEELRERPYATIPFRLAAEECARLAALWAEPAAFRSRVEMARHRFGSGEYRYLARPLPPVVEALRRHAYPPLAAIANGWAEALRGRERFPGELDEFLLRC